ncbi:cell wall-binding repeat-containing protein [Neobacillus sp. OS1-2]|uniref:cell wall-binding repeat-containing protein n=1 Tax=Neobacillus sp. OS1-2 TaxID=3070680 RepID=UPI0027E05B1E|nr:cell wall-binding repeat-containing protein [Neobacillus sp. OS1-2]WML41226.1 cell wall-binding repeat-containing protein [Neobacillus sp. OS1-2]
MLKKFLTGITSASLFLSIGAGSSFAETTLSGTTYQNPSYQEINKLLTESAIKYDIPPEIAKTLAYQESAWQQFDKNGEPYHASNNDGGIGIMQITNDPRFDQEKLKTDIQYNINAGLQKLDEKFKGIDGKLPILNNNERDILENWYFAILAYNGKVPSNSPIYQADGTMNTKSYQERFYSQLDSANNSMGIHPIPFDFKVSDFTYTENPPLLLLLLFNRNSYSIANHLLHTTKHAFKSNDLVLSAESANFRGAPSTLSGKVKTLPTGKKEAVTILDRFVYDESNKFDPSVDMRNKQYVWYKVKLQDGTIGYTASGGLQPLGKRLSGSTRFETAAAISQEGWPNGSDTVVLARGYDFPDALAGTTLSYQLNAPMLLTHDTQLTETTKNEINRLKAKKVILLGSSDAISSGVEGQLNGMGLQVSRIGGADRFQTATKIAEKMPEKGNTAIVAVGYNYPDALTIAPYAAKMGYPIFLSRTNELPEATKNALIDYKNTIVVGSENAISDEIMGQFNNPVRYGGMNRFETNYNIVNSLFTGKNGKAYIATGYNFADALTGAVLAAKNDAPLLLTYPAQVPDPIKNAIVNKKLHSYNLLGGSDVVGVENQIGEIFQEIGY